MPHKHNTKGRHHIPKMRHVLTNWPQYEAGLRRRGSLTLWDHAGGYRRLGGDAAIDTGRPTHLLRQRHSDLPDAARRVQARIAPEHFVKKGTEGRRSPRLVFKRWPASARSTTRGGSEAASRPRLDRDGPSRFALPTRFVSTGNNGKRSQEARATRGRRDAGDRSLESRSPLLSECPRHRARERTPGRPGPAVTTRRSRRHPARAYRGD